MIISGWIDMGQHEHSFFVELKVPNLQGDDFQILSLWSENGINCLNQAMLLGLSEEILDKSIDIIEREL